jgi:hypothetical protein
VVFPEPEGPASATTSPGRKPNFTTNQKEKTDAMMLTGVKTPQE